MKTSPKFITLALLSVLAGHAHAETILIQDDFTGVTGMKISAGITPTGTDLPGSQWNLYAGFTGGGEPVINNNSLYIARNYQAVSISLESAGSYVKTETFSISVDLAFTGGSTGVAGFALGFYSADPIGYVTADTEAQKHFTGLRIKENGTMYLWVDGVQGVSVANAMTLSRNTLYHFTYDVDTNTGDISNIFFNNVAYDFTTTAFTDSATTYAGIMDWGGSNSAVRADNFTLTTSVPEPATWAMMLGGLGLLGLTPRFRRLRNN